MVEAVEVAGLCPHELLSCELVEAPVDLVPNELLHEFVDRSLLEVVADNGGGIDHRSLLALQVVEPGGQKRLDRRRHPSDAEITCLPDAVLDAEESSVDHHREQLLDEQRVSLRCLDDSRERRLGDVGPAEEVVDDLRARVR